MWTVDKSQKITGGVKRLAHREQTSSLRVEARKLARNLENRKGTGKWKGWHASTRQREMNRSRNGSEKPEHAGNEEGNVARVKTANREHERLLRS